MKLGDILLIKYKYDPISWLIRKLTKSKWNHCAIAINSISLLDYRGKSLQINPLRRYLNKRLYKVKLVRLKGISEPKANKIIDYIVNSGVKGGYFNFLLTILLIALGYKGKLPRNTCSGLIAEAFHYNGYIFAYTEDYNITPEDINRRTKDVSNEL